MVATRAYEQSSPNPFPVYPVSALRDISPEILSKTVYTEAVGAIKTAIDSYVKQAAGDRRVGVAIPVRGDFGTGKTHLLVFAQRLLNELWPGGSEDVVVLSVPATEAPFSVWYLTMVVPLFDHLGLDKIFARLLANVACEVGDQVPLTVAVADEIRKDYLEVYPALRDGLLSLTDVERGWRQRIASLVPRSTEELRVVLAALCWPAKRDAALRWLSGRTLSSYEKDVLGVGRDMDAEAEASAVLVAIAGAVSSSGGLFSLMVDEFEHLMAEDRRTETQRNATTVKRLLEDLTTSGALVVVAGHWRAWEQLPDFKARFGAQRAIDLVTLTGKEIGQLVQRYAPQWAERLSSDVFEEVAEAGGRNIRRVMAVLHQLYADTAEGAGSIGVEHAQAAAEKRRRLAAEGARPEAVIGDAVRKAGGQVKRGEALHEELRFDLAAWQNEELRLVVDFRYASTSAQLTRDLEDFSIAFRAIRGRYPKVRGLMVASGALDRAALALLDKLPGIDALPGEGVNWESDLRGAVAVAFREGEDEENESREKSVAQEEEALQSLRNERLTRDKEASETRERVGSVDFGSDVRAAAASTLVRETAPAASTSAYGPDVDALDSFSESLRVQVPTVVSLLVMPSALPIVVTAAMGAVVLMTLLIDRDWLVTSFSNLSRTTVAIIYSYSTLFLLAALFVLLRQYQNEKRAFIRYQRWGRQKLEELLVRKTPSDELLRVKNKLIDAPDAAGGFRHAISHANEHLPEAVRDKQSGVN